jgi:hypothetical protein
MSKSGNYNLGEIEKRDHLIQTLVEACEAAIELIQADYPEPDQSSGELIDRGKPRKVFKMLCDAVGDAQSPLD